MKIKHRDLNPEESRRYRNPSVFTDPRVRIVYTDPGFEEQLILSKGFVESTPGFVRRWKLIEKGMLLQVECRPFVRWDHWVKEEWDMSIMLQLSEEEAAEYRRPIPDLVYKYSLDSHDPLPDFTQQKLTEYIHGFTERSIDLLKMDQGTAEFVRRNQGGVISYLVKKLEAGHHLSFYRASPKKNGPIAIADLTYPQKPTLLYLVYGLRPLLWEPPKGPHAYIPWMPCLESSEEA